MSDNVKSTQNTKNDKILSHYSSLLLSLNRTALDFLPILIGVKCLFFTPGFLTLLNEINVDELYRLSPDFRPRGRGLVWLTNGTTDGALTLSVSPSV